MNLILSYILLFLLIVIFLSELDRNYSYKYSIYDYYFDNAGIVIGCFNTLLRKSCYFNDELYNKPYINMQYFPNHYILQNNYKIIQEEALNIYNNYNLPSFHHVEKHSAKLSDDNWKVFVLKFYDNSLEQNCKQLCPQTCYLLNQLPEVKCAMFSILLPGKYIQPHRGPFVGGLRYHLCLKAPTDTDNCYIKVNNIKYNWKEGEDILFDDTFTHEVYNNTNEVRIVLFIDIARPIPNFMGKVNNTLINSVSFASYIKELNSKAEKTISIKK